MLVWCLRLKRKGNIYITVWNLEICTSEVVKRWVSNTARAAGVERGPFRSIAKKRDLQDVSDVDKIKFGNVLMR
jgi:hypothetical protein